MIVGIALLFVVFVLTFSNFLSTSLVGLATFTTTEGYTFSMDLSNDSKNVVVSINSLGKEVTGVYLEMVTTTTNLDLCKTLGDVTTSIDNKLWNGNFYSVSCANNTFMFSDASLSDQKKGSFTVLQFPVKDFPSNFELVVNPLDVYELEKGNDLFTNKEYKSSFNKTGISTQVVENKTETKQETPSAPSGGGTYCTSQWKCTDWSYCNNQLKQERVCSDIKGCQKNKAENRTCAKCDESWQCSAWSSCSYNQQTRKCSDEHSCGTVTKKPEETRSCTEVVPVVQPEQQYYQPPTQEYQQPQQPVVQQPVEVSFFDKYMTYLLAIPFVLLFVVILVLAVMHFTKRTPQTTFNYNELKDWMKKERAAGSSDDEIRDILAQNTGWKSEEISRMFTELGK